MYQIKIAWSRDDLEKIIALRYEVLRKPWNQTIDSAGDDLDDSSINTFIEENGKAIACGRLQENENKIGQIRFMAVSSFYQGKGLGKLIVKALENEAKKLDMVKIQLQARENAIGFYRGLNYEVIEKSFLLWDEIQHYLMEKNLQSF
jgi:N-acetylglutamate synthase-like GNAT family acetyltransferase